MDRQRTRARPRTSLTAPVVAFGGFHVCLNLKVQVQATQETVRYGENTLILIIKNMLQSKETLLFLAHGHGVVYVLLFS